METNKEISTSPISPESPIINYGITGQGEVPKSHNPLGYGTGTNPDSETEQNGALVPKCNCDICVDRQAISLEPFWRLSITLNCEPENLMILPPLDQSLEDKIILLKVNKRPMPMPTGTERERAAFWEKLMEELPAFLHSLTQFKIPDALKSERFGITHYHHPDLLAAIDAMAPETRLLALIDLEFFKLPTDKEWIGTAEELETALHSSDSSYHAKQLLNWPNATGTYLGRLAAKHGDRVKYHRTTTRRAWTITRV